MFIFSGISQKLYIFQISELRIHEGAKGGVSTISTVAGDGKLVIWDIASLASKLANLTL